MTRAEALSVLDATTGGEWTWTGEALLRVVLEGDEAFFNSDDMRHLAEASGVLADLLDAEDE